MKLLIKTPSDLRVEREARERDEARREAQDFLARTDWMVVRRAETGEPIPDDVVQRRQTARAFLSARN